MAYIVSIDQGTTSTRAIIFDEGGQIVASGQFEHEQHFPAPGWVEHDPVEIWTNVREAVGFAMAKANITRHDLAAVGITNQRETVVAWDPTTGQPLHRAIVWQDTRTQGKIDELSREHGRDGFVSITGLPLDAYFSASKFAWLLDEIPNGRQLARDGQLMLGTIDSWVLWNLTGGPEGGVHATDVTNASRTLLMDLRTCEWSPTMLELFDIPIEALPEIRPSSDAFGRASESSLLRGVPITGILGDQQAAAFGQAAFDPGQSKSTYGTGSFVLVNTGSEPVFSEHGLITTVAYSLEAGQPIYAIEGSIAVTGSLIQWLRDSLGIISTASEVEALASQVPDTGGVVVVPAFSGLLAPHWRSDARGAILGITRFTNHSHIARAALESVAMQTRDVLGAMAQDVDSELTELKVDGGMVANDLLMQIQADALGIPVVRPAVSETTALGAAFAAGLAVGFWEDLDQLRQLWAEDRRWVPQSAIEDRDAAQRQWDKGVERSFGWVGDDAGR
ncbi:glycerol kinase GlpK [Demequina flava]|uniref:glycerol kinase GlpK n=1 Tax=Demequina flava TaxID=1095025 RepID=UPI0007838EA5|nr:glycerol kinase GlpK [Demequina flava]